MFQLYKQTQGRRTRITTFVAGAILSILGAFWLGEKLRVLGEGLIYVRYGVPLIALLGLALLMFHFVNKPSMADFMIATEGEMKKVSWSSRREVIGSTKVVIFATFAMALMLYVVDVMFQRFFTVIGVLRIG